MSARNMAKRTAAGTLALAVCLGGGAIALASAASADANFKFDRIAAGTDRFDTAIQSSKTAFPSAGQAGGVVLVNGWRSVDGLTASSLAGAYQASILYSETDAVPQATRDEINRLGTKNIWLVGGSTVLSDKLEADLKSAGFTVNRVGGSDRFETAAKVSDATMAKTGKKPGHVFVASGVDGNLSDSTVLAPLAYSTGSPILLSEPGDAPKYTTDQLDDVKGAEIHVVGGKSALTDAVYNEVGAKDRIAGADRGETANYVSDFAKSVFGFSKANAALVGAKNSNVADSLAAAAFLGNAKTTIHYAGLDSTNYYLKMHAADLTGKGWIIGGKDVVTDDQVAAATKAAQTAVNLNSIKVTPSDAAAVTVADETGTKATSDDRVYTATGLDKDLKYRVTLVKAANIKMDKDGNVIFAEDGVTNLVDPGTLDSDITVVNGVPTGAPGTAVQSVGAISAPDGSLTFRVDGDGYENLVPVVYVDGGTSTRLELDDKNMSKEVFGLGGLLAVLPPEQTAGAGVAAGTVKEVFKDGGFIAQLGAAAPKLYKTDANDSFKVDGAQATWDTFKSRLTANDTITVTDYQTDSSLKSTFELTNVGPAALAPTAATPGERSVVLTLPTAGVADGATVNVYFANDTTTGNTAAPVYATTFTKKTFTVDDDSTTAGFQVTVSGLTPNQPYQFYTSQTTNGDESAKTGYESATLVDGVPAYVTGSVTPNDVNDGVGSTNEVVVTFDQEVSVLDASKFTVNPTTQTSFVFNGVSAKKANTSGTKWIVTLDKTLQDASTAVSYDFKIGANAVADSSGQKNVAATDTFTY